MLMRTEIDITDEKILQRFARVVSESLAIEPARVTMDAHLDTLGAESLDLVVIVLDIEEEFNIFLPDRTILKAAEEVFGPGVLSQDGKPTEVGKQFLLRRMPELRPEDLGEDVTLADLLHLFSSVRSWVRMIRGLMEHTPRVCAQCGTKFGKAEVGMMTCSQCGVETMMPTGDELNRRWIQEYYDTVFVPSQPKQTSAGE